MLPFVFHPAIGPDAPVRDAGPSPGRGEQYLILTVERAGSVRPMSMGFSPREGDSASVALHLPEAEEATAVLAAAGWVPVDPPGR